MICAKIAEPTAMDERPKVLIAADSEDKLIVLSALLHRDDVTILRAHNSTQALEYLRTHDVVLAFLDLHAADSDSLALAERMRADERARLVPIVFVVTGADTYPRQFAGYEAAPVDLVRTPLNAPLLKHKLDLFLRLHQQNLLLARALNERAEAVRFNELFVAMLGHELRNPLSVMIMSASLLQRSAGEPALQQMATQMLSSGWRMNRLIADMLDLLRMRQTKGLALHCEPLDLGTALSHALQEYQAIAPKRQLELALDGDLMGACDAERFSQVVSNLLSYAAHQGERDKPLHIRLDGTQRDTLHLSVSYIGQLSHEQLPHVFDPFHASHCGSPSGEGLGLYIVEQIARAHGGRVNANCADATTQLHVLMPRYATLASH